MSNFKDSIYDKLIVSEIYKNNKFFFDCIEPYCQGLYDKVGKSNFTINYETFQTENYYREIKTVLIIVIGYEMTELELDDENIENFKLYYTHLFRKEKIKKLLN